MIKNLHCIRTQKEMSCACTSFADASWFNNGYLDTPIDWIPAMPNIRLRDLPTFIRTTDPDDLLLNYGRGEPQAASSTSAVIINTFEELDQDLVTAIGEKFTKRRPYALGPLSALSQHIPNTSELNSINSNLWKEEKKCLEWLNAMSAASVVYVNFGSIVELTPEQLNEFAWGLAESNHPFLWVIRPDPVTGDLAVLEGNFVEETQGRGLIVGWCPQKKVLSHPSVGVFLTHCGWNSTIESISSGVPMLCWPFFADQQTNCRYICNVWEVGMEIDTEVKREEVRSLIGEMMEGEKGKKMREKAMNWKESARKASEVGGSSHCNLERFLNDLLAMKS